MRLKLGLACLIVWSSFCSFHQIFAQEGNAEEEALEEESLANIDTLFFDAFFKSVVEQHPLAMQAALLPEEARMRLMHARGNFDPTFDLYHSNKNFEETEYYNTSVGQVKVPLWFGADLKVGHERAGGVYLNPEHRVPDEGLTFAGISMPVARNLWTDPRRTAVRQAQAFQNVAQAQQIQMINRLLFQAYMAYWDWFFQYHALDRIQEALDFAQERFEGIRETVILEDMAPIDSVEAQILVQRRKVQLENQQAAFENATTFLSNFLWDEFQPLDIPEDVIPQEDLPDYMYDLPELGFFLNNALNHPDLLVNEFTAKQLEQEERLRKNNLLPFVSLEYNFLTRFPTGEDRVDFGLYNNNYKVGVRAYYPLFLRKERASLKINRIQLQDLDLIRSRLQREIPNEVAIRYREMQAQVRNIEEQSGMVYNQAVLREGEILKFENGESSLFLINARETNLIDMQVDLLRQKRTLAQKMAETLRASGNFDLE